MRYERMVKQGSRSIEEIINTEKVNRNESDTFFLMMYLKTCVPFFQAIEHHVMQKIFKKLDTLHLKKGEVIEEKGEDSPMMYVVMIGTVGLFSSKNVCDQKMTANQVFGMDFNRSQTFLTDNENNRVRRATAVALTDTICLSLDFPSYYDQVYILEHNYKQQRFSLIN